MNAEIWQVPDAVTGSWAGRRQLAAALRQLSERCVRADATAEELAQATALVRQALALLPDGPTARQAFSAGTYMEAPRQWMDRGAILGRSNPIAPPLVLTWDGSTSRGEIALDERFVGAPGLAHGGVIAACFDQICGHCAVMSGHQGLTVRLEVRYARPLPLEVPVVFTAVAGELSERRARITARCTRDGRTIATAAAGFVAVDRDRARELFTGDPSTGEKG